MWELGDNVEYAINTIILVVGVHLPHWAADSKRDNPYRKQTARLWSGVMLGVFVVRVMS